MLYDRYKNFTAWKTAGLVLLFCLGVLMISMAATLVISIVAGLIMVIRDAIILRPRSDFSMDTVSTLLIILGVAVVSMPLAVIHQSLRRTRSLRRGGGGGLAQGLGGTPVTDLDADVLVCRLLNVVEEMSVAMGRPAPEVYVLVNEPGINAFAAGFDDEDTVIGVTRGALELLTRDELQALVAHEFSHIVNRDTRLNMRLMGYVHGLMFSQFSGLVAIDPELGPVEPERTPPRMKNNLFMYFMQPVGLGGAYFGNLMKALISRQREFLADAAAVHFTRNAQGMAGVLKKISGYAKGSVIGHPRAVETSHMFFSSGMSGNWRTRMAMHPPLEERIRRIEPGWRGDFPVVGEDVRRSVLAEALAEKGALMGDGAVQELDPTLGARPGNSVPAKAEPKFTIGVDQTGLHCPYCNGDVEPAREALRDLLIVVLILGGLTIWLVWKSGIKDLWLVPLVAVGALLRTFTFRKRPDWKCTICGQTFATLAELQGEPDSEGRRD